MTEPEGSEGYEHPPVSSRYRATEDRAGSGAPASEFWTRPPARQEPAPAPAGEHAADQVIVAELAGRVSAPEAPEAGSGAVAPGGPRFVGAVSPPVTSTRSGRRAQRRAAAAAPPGIRGSSWSLPAPSRARRLRPLVIPVVVLVILGVAAYVAYPHVRTFVRGNSAPADLRSYVNGHGVVYTPVGQGYSVRLPGVPVHRDQQVTSSDGKRTMLVRRSITAGADYQIVIRVDEVAKGALGRSGLAGALQDPFLAGSNAPASVHKTVIGGETAYAGEVHARKVLPFEVAVVMHAGRLYAILIESRSVGTVFDAVAKSFRFTG